MRTTRGVRFPVELVSCQPFDDFPPRCFGVSRTNRSIFEIRAVQQDGPMKTRGLFYLSPAFILFCCPALHRRHQPPAFQREVITHEQNISSRRYVLCRFGPGNRLRAGRLLLKAENGLELPSLVLMEQLRTIDKRRLETYIGHLEEQHIPACANNFYGTGSYYLRRVHPGRVEKDICTYCGQRPGFDYEVVKKKERK